MFASSSVTFTVTFDPSATGIRTGEVSYANSDSDENPYNYRVVGTGVTPEMGMLGTNQTGIADGSTATAVSDGTDFGSVEMAGGQKSHVFTITNTGSSALYITGVSTGGAHAVDFAITMPSPTNVFASSSVTFTHGD